MSIVQDNHADALLGLMEAHGIKPTANRLLIARALASQSRPLSMAELEAQIETIDKSVISRSLSLFRQQHLVHTLEDGSEGVRYELCRSHGQEHDDDDTHVHFHCERCGRTFCLNGQMKPEHGLFKAYGEFIEEDIPVEHEPTPYRV